ncbi:nuA3 HAT complex component nto1 [Globomyces sp. JEL0801]|nr:nuA3 HAT complex component nto1 [Globomyces sp. JEL0801]
MTKYATNTKNSTNNRPSKTCGKGSTTPQEERSYRDFYPDLRIQKPLQILRLTDLTNDELPTAQKNSHAAYLENPLPAIAPVFSKPVPTPVFKIIQHTPPHTIPPPLPPYTTYIEPSEDQLAQRTEYDMDEQDKQWLSLYNSKLSETSDIYCDFDYFEWVMDQLEKHWFDLVKDIPKDLKDTDQYPEDITCSVCDDGEAENSNAIVFCDGCDLAVHQDCYGIPFIPEGQWLCRKCMLSPETPVSCVLCPTDGGAYKQTNTNKWAHLTCAMWIPECHIQNVVYMEPIEGVEAIPKSRWKLTCYICHKRHGAPIQCSSKTCCTAYHATCARKAKLYMKMRGQGVIDSNHFRSYCDRHCPKEYKEKINVDESLRLATRELSRKIKLHQESPKNRTKKRKIIEETKPDGGKKMYSLKSPIIPVSILNEIASIPCPFGLKKKKDLIITISRYWALKKESRRGAALLKRLHLELLTTIRKDLEKIRLHLDMIRKREKQKLRVYRNISEQFELAINPIRPLLIPLLDKLKKY